MRHHSDDSHPQPYFGVLSPRLVDALIGACVAWQRQRRADGLQPDPEVSDFTAALAGARRGLAGTPLDVPLQPTDSEDMTSPRLLTYSETAARLSVSERQVKRLIASGLLRRVRVGAAARVHTDELTDYLTTLRQEAS